MSWEKQADKKTKMAELVDQVIADMEGGKICPWEKPWFSLGVRNWLTGRMYNGCNTLSLGYAMGAGFKAGQFLTYKQASQVGGQVKKGSHGFPIFFYSPYEAKDKATGEDVTKFALKTYIVFNVEQVEGIQAKPEHKRELSLNEIGEKILSGCGARITHHGGMGQACYSVTFDTVELPNREQWKTDEGFYSVAFHELVHWTQTPERCNRVRNRGAEDDRAFEELVAELGGAYLAAFCGFAYNTQHVDYIKGWVSLLKDHHQSLYSAASKAQKACNYILKASGLLIEAEKEEVAAA